MPTWQEVEAAKAAEAATDLEVTARTQTLPPGYIKGFDLTIDGDTGALTIDAGFADVNGVFVRRNDTHIVLDEDYNVLELASMRYYIYITKEAKYWIDVVAPEYSTLTFGNYHPEFVYRYIAEFYMDADKKISVANSLEKNPGQIVVVASSAYKGLEYDRICDGTRDDVEINAAITYLSETYGGGIVEITEGTFYTAATIVPKANIVLQGRGWSSVIEKNGDFHGISAVGTDGSEIDNITIRDLQCTKNTADTNAQNLIDFEYCDSLLIEHVRLGNSKQEGIYLEYCDNYLIEKCFAIAADSDTYFTYRSIGVISKCDVDGENDTRATAIIGIRVHAVVFGGYSLITGCQVLNLKSSDNVIGIYYSAINGSINDCLVEEMTSTGVNKYSEGIQIGGANIQCVNNHIIDCDALTATYGCGIHLFVPDDTMVTNNYVTGCSDYGIRINNAVAERCLINSNFCYNNGDDAGIANINENNFYDRGTDTFATANSWQEHTGNADNNGQRVMNGLVDAHGDPEFLSEENIGNVSLMATTTPTLMSFANGWDGDSAANFMKQVAADVEPAGWKNLLGLTRHFLYADYSAGAITYGKTLVPPAYSRHFHATHRFSGHSLLHFEEVTTPLDEYTNSGSPDGDITWTASGAARSAVQKKWGTYSYLFDGANDYIETTDITDLQRPFTLETEFYTTDDTTVQYVLGSKSTYSFMIRIRGDVAGDPIEYYISSNGAAWDIASAVQGVAITTKDTWHKLTFEWDGSFYRVYIDAILDIETASTTPMTIMTGLQIGNYNSSAGDAFLGYIDEFRAIIGNCRYGTAHAVETEAFTPDAQWFDTQGMKWYEGSPASWTEKKRLILGEADADRRVGALLHLNGTDGDTDWTKLIDEYGNKWTFAGTARLEEDDGTNTPKFGDTFLWLDGNSDYVKRDLYSEYDLFEDKVWTLETWWHTRNAATDNQPIFYFADVSGHGLDVRYDTTGPKLNIYLSSNGTSFDIVNGGVSDNITVAANTWYKFTMEFDGSNYKIYMDGALIYTLANSNGICPIRYIYLGWNTGVYLDGGFDEFRLTIGHNQYGATHTPETAEFATEGTIDTVESKMLRNTMDSTHDTPGFLTLIPEEERAIGWDVSVNPTTAWTSIDLSKICPPGTIVIYGFALMYHTDSVAVLCTRCSCSEETTVERTTQFWHKGNAADYIGVPMMISARHGKFDIRESSATTELALFNFRLHGWYRR